ncbi:MAG: 2-isopropylmalate synthase [Sphaerochaetaceae bacterium]
MNKAKRNTMADNHIFIFDTTLRDGEQAPGYSMNLEEKIRMAKQLRLLGVDILEAGFAIASPGDFESVRAIASAVDDTVVASLSRALTKDIDAAWEAVKQARRPRIHTFLATSDLHLQYKLKMSREHALEQAVEMVSYARNLCDDVEFSCEDATRTDLAYLCQVVEAVIKAGATTVNLPDTVGYATPKDMRQMFSTVLQKVDKAQDIVLSTHCHNDLGLAVANTLASLDAGARQAECTVCGIGERAGNASLEELVMNIRTRSDEYPFITGIDSTQIYRSARLLSSITGVKVNPSKAIVGANAFAHESGIHQHGMMANSRTYEIMTPESVGVQKTSLVLGKHSGAHALQKRLEELGYHIADEDLENLFEEFKNVADRKKTVTDRDLIALVESTQKPKADAWRLVSFVVNSGNTITSTACVTLQKEEKTYQEVAFGTGPVYSALRAVEKIIHHPFSLEDYSLQAVTEHRDALGEVLIKISDGTGFYRGRGVSTDVIEASLLSCLSAVNHMLDASVEPAGQGVSASTSTLDFANDMLLDHSDKRGTHD